MKLKQISPFRLPSAAMSNWHFRSSANLIDSPYVKPVPVKLGVSHKIALGMAAVITATSPAMAQTTPAATSGAMNGVEQAINYLTMPFSIAFSYVTGGSAHQKGFLVTAMGIAAYVAARVAVKKWVNNLDLGRSVLAKVTQGTMKHAAGVAASLVTYYAAAPAIIEGVKYVINAWAKF